MYKKGTWAHIYYHVVIFIWYHKITVTISVKGHLFFREHSINKYIANHHVIQLGLACFILKSNFCQTSLYLYDIDLVHTTINTIYRSDPTVNIMVSTLKQGNNLYKLHMQNGRLMHAYTHTFAPERLMMFMQKERLMIYITCLRNLDLLADSLLDCFLFSLLLRSWSSY